MSFYQKYELREFRRGDGVKCFSGREIATGRPVEVHLFTAGRTPENARLLDRLGNLAVSERRHLVELGEHEGTPYAVTRLPAGMDTLEQWVQSMGPAPAAPPPPAAPSPPPYAPQPGGAEPLMQAGTWRIPIPPKGPPQQRPAAEPQADPGTAGEFTRAFRTGSQPAAPQPPAQPAAPPHEPG